jgi:hypothetical protein
MQPKNPQPLAMANLLWMRPRSKGSRCVYDIREETWCLELCLCGYTIYGRYSYYASLCIPIFQLTCDVSEWEKALKAPGVQAYFPRLLEIMKAKTGIPELNNRLYGWQLHIFRRVYPTTFGKTVHFFLLIKGRAPI